jgi:hypothetical protein
VNRIVEEHDCGGCGPKLQGAFFRDELADDSADARLFRCDHPSPIVRLDERAQT